MKISERYLWIASLILLAFIIQSSSTEVKNAEFLRETYKAECEIQKSQINDFRNALLNARDLSYSTGFEEGRSQAGIAFSQGRPMLGYSDGYHAALSQFASKESLESQLLREIEEDIVKAGGPNEIEKK